MIQWPPRKVDLPNILTVSRLLLLPFMIILFLIPKAWAAWTLLAIYIPAAVSDYFDGYLARAYAHVSPVGVFLDPIADKLFVGTTLFMLAATGRLEQWWAVPALLIMLRELLIAGLREFLGAKEVQVPVSRLAKWKTGVQMTAIGFLIMWPYISPDWPSKDFEQITFSFHVVFAIVVEWIGKVGLLFAMALTLKTGWDYTKASWPYLQGKHPDTEK
jgi:cardiolipin synthase